jgi:hypothetical protein
MPPSRPRASAQLRNLNFVISLLFGASPEVGERLRTPGFLETRCPGRMFTACRAFGRSRMTAPAASLANQGRISGRPPPSRLFTFDHAVALRPRAISNAVFTTAYGSPGFLLKNRL